MKNDALVTNHSEKTPPKSKRRLVRLGLTLTCSLGLLTAGMIATMAISTDYQGDITFIIGSGGVQLRISGSSPK